MSKPKFSINERVMVRCHSSKEVSGKAISIDDCVITQYQAIGCIFYEVDQRPGIWISETFIFPYQQPGSSFKEQMQELDRPIKQLEPA